MGGFSQNLVSGCRANNSKVQAIFASLVPLGCHLQGIFAFFDILGVFLAKKLHFLPYFAEILGIDKNTTNASCVKIWAQFDHFQPFSWHFCPFLGDFVGDMQGICRGFFFSKTSFFYEILRIDKNPINTLWGKILGQFDHFQAFFCYFCTVFRSGRDLYES